MKKSLPFAACILFLAACQTDKKPSEAPQQPSAMLVCETIAAPEDGDMPLAAVYAQIGDTKIKVAELSVCRLIAPEEYADLQVPAGANSAVGGFWAGAGDYLYTITQDGITQVFQGGMYEGQVTSTFGYMPTGEIAEGRYKVLEPKPRLSGLYACDTEQGTLMVLIDEVGGVLKGSYAQASTPLNLEEAPFDITEHSFADFNTFSLNGAGNTLSTDWGKALLVFTENGPLLTFDSKTDKSGQALPFVQIGY